VFIFVKETRALLD